MKRFAMFACAGLFVAALIGLVPVLSQDMGGGGDAMGGDEACAGETPPQAPPMGSQDPNGVLKLMEGDWDCSFTAWMEPGTDPIKMDFKLSAGWTLQKQFITTAYDMKEGPFPHQGIEYYSFNEATEEYENIRITSASGSIIVFHGKFDEKKKSMELKAEYKMAWGGNVFDVKGRNVYTFDSADKRTFTGYSEYVGVEGMEGEHKEVEIVFTRAKPAKPATQDPNGILGKLLGTFDMDFALYMEPGKDPLKMNFEMRNEWSLDGQFLRAEYEMNEGPIPHKGVEFFSYNEATGEYQEVRLTSMSGMQVVYTGKYDAGKKTLELKASYAGQMGDMKYTATSREVYVWKDDDNFTCTVYTKYDDMPDMPDEVKEVEIIATRKQ